MQDKTVGGWGLVKNISIRLSVSKIGLYNVSRNTTKRYLQITLKIGLFR